MKNWILTTLVVTAVGFGTIASVSIDYQAQLKVGALQKEIAAQSATATDSAKENFRLNAAFDSDTNAASFSADNLTELLKLRNEHAQLVRSNAELARLRLKNQKLRASVESNASPSAKVSQ